MARTPAATPRQLNFLFADHLVLDESPTRDFYKEMLRGWAHKNNNVLAVVQGVYQSDPDDGWAGRKHA